MNADHFDNLTFSELLCQFDHYTALARLKGLWLHQAYPWHCAYFKARLPHMAGLALDAAGVQ